MLNVLVGLRHGELADNQRQPARACKRLNVCEFQTMRAKTGGNVVGQRSHQAPQRFRRQLLGADFQQQVVVLCRHQEEPSSPRPVVVSIGKPSVSRDVK